MATKSRKRQYSAATRLGQNILRAISALIFLFPITLRPTASQTNLAFLGDVMLGRSVAVAYATNWEEALATLSPQLQAADLALANLESPLSTSSLALQKSADHAPNYNLCAPAAAIHALNAAGFDLLSLANNHQFDCHTSDKANAAAETSALLAQSNITAMMPGYQPVWRTFNGTNLAFFAFNDVSAPLDSALAASAVTRATGQGGWVIVSMHWGIEYSSSPHSRQIKLAQILADAGARLIWGHHPHAIQPVSWIWGNHQKSPALVAYSLGNALFDQVVPPITRHGALLHVTIQDGQIWSTDLQTFDVNWKPGGY